MVPRQSRPYKDVIFFGGNYDSKILMHAKLIRDIDKLDIMHIYGDLNELETKITNDQISKLVLEQFSNHESVLKKYIKNTNDKIVLILSFAFDINYYVILNEFKIYLNHYYEKIKENNIFKELYEEAMKYIDERIDKNVRN